MSNHQSNLSNSSTWLAQQLEIATAVCVRGELERIGETVNVCRLRGECNTALADRISLALAEEICARESLLDMVISLSKATRNHKASR